jgi:hypothetical protein
MTDGNDEADDLARARDDALRALRDAREWVLTQAEWSGIAAILNGLGLGLGRETGRLDLAEPKWRAAVEDATVRLELAEPRRIEAVDRAAEPAPPEVRERINTLIEALSATGEEDGKPGGNR